MSKLIDLTGQRFGLLVVIERTANKGKQPAWLCKCDCGNECIVIGTHLKTGHSQSCGCLQRVRTSKARKKHGMSKDRPYRIWENMKSRCSDSENPAFEEYGGRGITVCEEWKEFENFYSWAMANGYSEELTIDRIDTNGGYCPENCRWTNRTVQQNNRRNNKTITCNGKTMTLAQWSRVLGIKYTTLHARLYIYHWDVEKAFKTS